MENFKHLAKNFETLPILKEIQDHHWKADTYLRDYPQGPFGDTESIILRFPPRTVHETEQALKDHEKNFDQHENVWQEVSKELPTAKNVALWLMNQVNGTRLGRVIINKVAPGGIIYPHEDTPVHALYWSRYHIVLLAKPGNDFTCGNESINMLTGDIYYFRNDLMHSVVNNSGAVRIHMVVDIKDEIEKPIIESKNFNIPEEIEIPRIYSEGISYQLEKLVDVIEELKPFVPLHWSELGLTKEEVPVDMDWNRFLDLEKNNKLQLVIVRDSGKVIGYVFTFIGGHYHYKDTLHAIVDLYYLLPEYRKGRTGIKMFQFAEKCYKDIGVIKVITGCKLKLDHTRLFEFLGFEKSDYQFIKII